MLRDASAATERPGTLSLCLGVVAWRVRGLGQPLGNSKIALERVTLIYLFPSHLQISRAKLLSLSQAKFARASGRNLYPAHAETNSFYCRLPSDGVNARAKILRFSRSWKARVSLRRKPNDRLLRCCRAVGINFSRCVKNNRRHRVAAESV